MENDCVTRVDDHRSRRTDWQKLASTLVGERLAACVNVLGEMESVYRWKGQVEIRPRAADRHQDHGRAGPRAAGAVARPSRLRAARVHRRADRRGKRRLSAVDQRVGGRVISFAPFLPSGSPRSRSKCFVWLAAPDQAALDRAVNFALIALAAALGLSPHEARARRRAVAGQPQADSLLHPRRRRADSAAGHVLAAGISSDLLRRRLLSGAEPHDRR